jgi:hypothetical protein
MKKLTENHATENSYERTESPLPYLHYMQHNNQRANNCLISSKHAVPSPYSIDFPDPADILVHNVEEGDYNHTKHSSTKPNNTQTNSYKKLPTYCATPCSLYSQSPIDYKKDLKIEEPKKKMSLAEQQNAKYLSSTISADLSSKKPLSARASQLTNKVMDSYKKQCTFKPSLNKSEILTANKNSRMERLLEPKTTMLQKRERQRQLMEEKLFQQNCSFKPQLYNSFSARRASNEPITERLHHEADQRASIRERKLREKEEEQLKECTFKPNLNNHASKIEQRPIHDRFLELQKAHNQKMQSLRAEAEYQNQKLFKPKVDQRSNAIMEGKKSTEGELSVTERMIRDTASRLAKASKQAREDYYTERTNVNTYRNPLECDQNINFINRQEQFSSMRKQKIEQHAIKLSNNCTFKPAINFTSEILVDSDPQRSMESQMEKYERLSYKDAKKRELSQKAIKKQMMESCPFKPSINTVSKTLGRQITVQEMANDEQRKINIHAISEQVRNEQLKECIFNPIFVADNTKYNAESHYANPSNVLLEAKKAFELKKQKALQLERDQEYYQMLECSFKPKTNEAIMLPPKPAKVQGLERKAELMGMKARHDKELKEKENKLYPSGLGSARLGYTHTQPFKLETERRANNNTKCSNREYIRII